MSDAGNAECLVALVGDEFRSCKAIAAQGRESKGIFHWNGHVWNEDTTRAFRDQAKWTARARRILGDQLPTKQERATMRNWAESSENLYKLEAACEIASTDPALLVDPELWDADPLRLGVLNGVIDFRTGGFVPPDPNDYITQVAAVEFNPEARSILWERVIFEIFEDQPEVVSYMQRVLGYMLTGLTSEHVMWFWYGSGANGKSTIINVMNALLGTMAGTASFSTFDDRNDNDKGDDLAILRGKRFVAASEGERQRRIAEAKIKTVVSSDRIRCRFLYGTFFEYRPTWKLVLATNHLPEVKGTDSGIWRRIHMVQFNQSFEGNRRDRDLEIKLRRELSGIFNWCLAGLKDYLTRGGFDPPESVAKSTTEMRTENDTVAQWFEEAMLRDEGESLERAEGFQHYKRWCQDNGDWPIGRASWQKRLESLGIKFSRNERGRNLARGWKINHD